MKTTVVEDICVGCGMCAHTCPEVYEMKNDKAVVIAEPAPKEVEEKVKQAASEYPVEAIKVE